MSSGVGFALIFLFSFLISLGADAARLKGDDMDGKQFKAILKLSGSGAPINGKVRFLKRKRVVFTAYDGTEADLRIRPICAHGGNEDIDACWPNLQIERDEVNSQTGTLRIIK